MSAVSPQAREKKSAALGQAPGRELGAYAGKYHSDRLGSIDLRIDQGHLTARYGVLSSPLYPQGGDEFLTDWLGDDSLNSVQVRFEEKGGVALDWVAGSSPVSLPNDSMRLTTRIRAWSS